MPMYDRICNDGHELIDCFEPINVTEKSCPTCGSPTKRAWISKSCSVIQDSIEGGVLIYHGICNDDGSPRKYYSKSEMAKEAKRKGLVSSVRHITNPKEGTDKNPHTTRWV